MLKRILSLVLSLVLVLSMVPVSSSVTAEGAEHVHCMCGEETTKDATCASCGTKAVVWTGIDKMPATSAPGNYYLTKDITAAPAEYPSGTFAFCLCGHKITSSNGKRIIGLTGATMSFTDCGTTGLITGATAATNPGSLMRIGSGSTFNLYAGKISDNKGTGNGIISVCDTATFNMYGGEISGNECGRGAIYVQDTGVTVRLLGGLITGNTGKNAAGGMAGGGGVYGMKGTVELGGTIQIYGNTSQDTGKSGDMYIRNDQGCKLQLSAAKPLANGAKVNYGTWTAGTEANNYGITVSAAPANWSSTWLRYNGTKLAISGTQLTLDTSADHIHCMCGKEIADGKTCADCGTKAVEWTGTNTVPNTDGFYYLTENVKTDKVSLTANVALCLHDKKLESKSGDTIVKTMPGYSMVLTACGTGVITGSTSAYPVEVQVNSAFTMYGGKITGNTYTGNGIVFIAQGTASLPGGSFTMYGGEISGNKVGRGTIFTAIPANATNKLATVRLLGGVITGNEGLNNNNNTGGGAGVYALSPVEIGGNVQIYGNTAKVLTNDIYLRNDGTFTGKLVVSTEKPLEDGANVNYGLKTAESDTTNLKSITGTPANWSNQWVKLGTDKVGYQDGKFLIDNSVPAQHIHCMCGAEKALDATCASCGTKAVLWTGTDKMPTKDEPGYYFLKSDVATGEVNYANGGAFGICLNGHALRSEAGSQIFELFQGATMDMTDCGTTGTITGATGKTTYGSAMRVDKGAVLTLWNGHITGNTASDDGIIYVDGSADAAVAGGTFIMYGGKISGNTSRRGAVYGVSTGVNGPVIKILGGEITGNTGTGTGNMKGGAGVYSFFPVEIGGNAKIYGNTAAEGLADLYLRNDGSFTGKVTVSADKPLTTGANIQYGLAVAEADETDLKFITGAPATWDKTWVTYAGDAVSYADGKFFTKEPAPVLSNHIHCLCGAEKTLDATCASCGSKAVRWDGITAMPTNDQPGYYYLTGDTATTETQYAGDKTFSICLNGHELKTSTGYKILQSSEGATVNFTDCADTMGTITGCTKATYGNTMRVNKGGTIVLWNGNITGNTASDDGIIYVDGSADAAVAGGTFIMYGGKISGNTSRRGAVYGVSTGVNGPVIKILGGEITGNTGTGTGNRKGGAGVYSFFPVEIGGNAKIYGNTAAEGLADLYLRNDGTYTGKVIVSNEKPLTTGANIQYALEVAEADETNLKYITGSPAAWDKTWVTYDGHGVQYADGKFFYEKVYDHVHCLCGAETTMDTTCAKCGTKAVGWDGIDKMPTNDQPGYYYLTGDTATTEIQYSGDKTFSICLNGHELKTSSGHKILQSSAGATVNITDCADTMGTITGCTKATYGNTMRVNQGGTIVLWNGNITGNTASDDGIIYVDGSNDAAVAGGTFIMYGGKISGNTSRRGAVYGVSTGVNGPVIKILGGEITGNTGTGTGNRKGGAGVYSFFPVEVGGNAKIYGNTAAEGLADLYLRNDGTYTGKVIVSDEKPLENGANICYGLEITDADPMDLVFITGKPASWNQDWVKYEGRNVGYEDGRFYTKHSMEMSDHNHGGQKWISVKQNNDQLPTGNGHYVLEEDVKLEKLIVIGKDTHVFLCLNGKTLTAAQASAHFEIQEGGKLTICDCSAKTVDGKYTAGKITGGTGKTGGAMRIRSGGEFYFENGIFTGNACAEGGNGGVVYADSGAKIHMTGGAMCGNTGAMGGAIRLGAPNVDGPFPTFIMEGGSICHNESINMGGGVYAAGGADIRLLGGEIANNKAAQGGGGIAVNSQAIDGKDLVTLPTTITLTGTTIRDNEATTWGGNVYIKTGTVLNMESGIISGGKSKVGAGVLLESTGTTLNLKGGKINGNHAGTAGAGGVYASTKTIVSMTGGEICNNTTESSAAGIVLVGAKGTITGGSISGNGGTGVNIQGSEVLLGQVLISNNTSQGSAGGVYVSRTGSICADVTIDGAQIINNTCKTSGGGLFLYMNGNKVTMKSGKISGNVAGDGGGVVAQREVTFIMEGGEITSNRSTANCGGFYASIDSTFIMNGGKIANNYSARNGGGVYCLRSNVQLNGGTISGNTAKNATGGVHINGSKVKLAGTSITGNKAETGSGGGVFVGPTTATIDGVKQTINGSLVMTGGSISYNSTPKAGGGLLLQSKGTVVDMYGGSINNNTSTKFAGGIYVGKNAAFNMHGGKVCYNKSENDVGGGIHHDGGTGNYTGGEIFGNSSPRSGGGLLVGGSGNVVNLKNVKIYDNTAKVAAGVILQGRATLNMEDCEIYNNQAIQNGGGIYAYTYVTLNAKNCHIHDNVAGIDGAGLWSWATSYTNLEGCLFENNKATEGQGGAIWTRGDGFNVTDCTFRSNTAAKQGGAFFAGWMGAATPRAVPGIYVEDSTFEKNSSNSQGGAMYISSGAELHMSNSVFTENTAAAEAGALWVKDEFTLDGLTVTGNTSGGEGYALWLDDSDFDGASYFAGLMRFSGNIRVLDNKGGDMYLGEKTPIIIGEKGLGQDTEIRLTMHSGLLTDWVWGAYNYEGGDQVYTITYGDRSLTDPEVAAPEEEATEPSQDTQATEATETTEPQSQDDNSALYMGIGGIAAVVVLAAVVLVVVKKKSASKAKE